MSVTVITPVELAFDTVSADIGADCGAIVATTPTDGWTIAKPAGKDWQLAFLYLLVDASGDTITIAAGDNPPSARAGLGAKALVLAASDVRLFPIEPGRYQQDDGSLLVTCTDAGTKLACVFLPKL